MNFEQVFEDLYPSGVVRAGLEREIRERVPGAFSIPTQIRQLKELYDAGVLSADEFEKAKTKAKLLG